MLDVDSMSLTLLLAAAGVAATHTVLGPDHYLPFLMLARARRWSRARVLWVTLACGIGHVGSSLLLGTLGLLFGAGVGWVDRVEGHRGNLAAWALVAVGAAYTLWGVRRAVRAQKGMDVHAHGHLVHMHAGGHQHHLHAHDHARAHGSRDGTSAFWALFVVFVLGPCEPLIPLFVLPASRGAWSLAAWTGVVFGAVTLASMLALVWIGHAGLTRLPLGRLERWSHAMAGGVIVASGLAVALLGL